MMHVNRYIWYGYSTFIPFKNFKYLSSNEFPTRLCNIYVLDMIVGFYDLCINFVKTYYIRFKACNVNRIHFTKILRIYYEKSDINFC